MFRLSFALVLSVVCLAAVSGTGLADEPAKEFLEALRSRGYYAEALEYLDSLQGAAPASFQETLPYERGITLLLGAKGQKDSALRAVWLADGKKSLQKFVAENKESPLVPQALLQIGNAMVEQARLLMKKSESAAGGVRSELLSESREHYAKAQSAFESIAKSAGEQLKALPAKVEDPKKADEQQRLRTDLLQALLLAAATSEEAAETLEKGSAEQIAAYTGAADRYEKIYKDYRTRMAGLYARMYQARCQQKLGKHQEAVVLFDELMKNPDEPDVLRTFKLKVVALAVDSWMEEKQYQKILDSVRPLLDSAKDSEEKAPEFLELRVKMALAAKALAEEQRNEQK